MLTKQMQIDFLKSHKDLIKKIVHQHRGQGGAGFFSSVWSGFKKAVTSPIVKEISVPIFNAFIKPYIEEKLKGSSGGSLKLSGQGKKKVGNARIGNQPAVMPRFKRGNGVVLAGVR